MDKKKSFAILVGLFVVVFINNGAILARHQSSSVWGYDLSEYLAVKERNAWWDAYTINDDVWFAGLASFEGKPSKSDGISLKDSEYLSINFFSGKKQLISGKQYNKSSELNRKQRVSLANMIINQPVFHFTTGNTLEIYHSPAGNRCIANELYNHMILKDKKGKVIKRVSVFTGYQKPLPEPAGADCGGWDSEPEVHQQIYSLVGYPVMLKDDTFLLFDDQSNMIVRFDKNLETKFQPTGKITTPRGIKLSTNLYILPYETVEAIGDEQERQGHHGRQAMHDALLKYLEAHYAVKN